MKTINKQFYTFMTKGLSEKEIEFLAECERMYFEGLTIDLEFLKKAKDKTGIKKFSSAWGYWKTINGRFVAHRDSLKNPVELDDVLGEGRLKLYDRANYNTLDKTYSIKSAEANNRILWDCGPYLEIITRTDGTKALHLGYNKIIGGFKIAAL